MKEKITPSMLASFRQHLFSEERSELTVLKYMRDLRHFVCFSHGAPVDREKVLAYKAFLEREYAVASANSMLASLNSFFRFAGWEPLRVRQFKVQKKVFCPEEKELSREEFVRLCRTAEKRGDSRLNLILQTICSTGIRVSELRFVTVEAVAAGETMVSCKGKTRTVFFVRELRKRLSAYCKSLGLDAGPVFVTKNGKPVDRVSVWRAMKRLCEEAGVSPGKVFPHNLRHLFARVFYTQERDIVKLADLLGHSSVETTRIYVLTSGAEHRRKMERMRLIL